MAPSLLQVLVQGPTATDVSLAIPREGGYTYTYCARVSGVYVISATIDGFHVRCSPAVVEASTDLAHAPLCEVLGIQLTLNTVAGAQENLPCRSPMCITHGTHSSEA